MMKLVAQPTKKKTVLWWAALARPARFERATFRLGEAPEGHF